MIVHITQDREFVRGVVDMTQNEKDPRNLMLVFEIIKLIVTLFDISSEVQEVFDSFFCYFPISFRAPTTNPFGVTSQGLKQAHNQLFGELAIPLIVEKLAGTSMIVKKDCMDVLSACMLIYGPKYVSPFALEIYNILKQDLFITQDPEFMRLAVLTVQQLLSTLEKMSSNVIFDSIVRQYCDGCVGIMRGDASMKEAAVLSSIIGIASVSGDCYHALTGIISNDVLECLKSGVGDVKLANRVLMMLSLVSCVKARTILTMTLSISHERDPVLSMKDRLFELFSLSISSSDPKITKTGIEGLKEMSMSPGLMSKIELRTIVDYLTSVMMTCTDADILDVNSNALYEISNVDCAMIMDTTNIVLESIRNERNSVAMEKWMNAVCIIGRNERIMDMVVRSLMNIGFNENFDGWFVRSVLNTVTELLTRSGKVMKLCDDVVGKFFEVLYFNKEWSVKDKASVGVCSALVAVATRFASDQYDFVMVFDSRNGIYKTLCELHDANEYADLFASYHFFLTRSILCNIAPEVYFLVEIDLKVLDTKSELFLDLIVASHKNSMCDVHKTMLCEVFGSLMNKLKCDRKYLDVYVEEFKEYEMIGWILKGLVLKCDPVGFEIVDKILVKLDYTNHCEGALEVLRNVTSSKTNDGVLTKAAKCIVKKFYSKCMPKILENYQCTTNKPTYLKTMSLLMKSVTKQIVQPDLEKLLPMMLNALRFTDSELKETGLSAIREIINDKSELVEKHITSLIPNILSFCESTADSNLAVKLKAVDLLGFIPSKIKYSLLHPIKEKVLRLLGGVVCDKKRVVRKAAANARLKWYLMATKDE